MKVFAIVTIIACLISGACGGQARQHTACSTLRAACAKAVQKQVNAKVGARDVCWIATAEDTSGVQCWDPKHNKAKDWLLRIQITQHGKVWHVVSVGHIDGTGRAHKAPLSGVLPYV